MASALAIERTTWLGYRWSRHSLGGRIENDALDDLLLLGFPDGWAGGSQHALIQRTLEVGSAPVSKAISVDGPLVSLWSVRGAPHAHPVTHLDFVRDAFRPQEDEEGGLAYVAAVDAVASALTAVVTEPTSKGDASAKVAARVPSHLVQWCQRCQAKHVPDGLFRAGGRQAQLVVGTQDRGTILHPPPKRRQTKIADPRRELTSAYLRVNGPTSKAQFREWMGTSTAAVTRLWSGGEDDMVRVRVDGRPCDVPESLLGSLQGAPSARGVVLVPPGDPYLRQADRTLLVPDAQRRHQVWRPLSPPGAVLVDGEVAGFWRYRRTSHELTVTPFEAMAPAQRKQAKASAHRLDGTATISWE